MVQSTPKASQANNLSIKIAVVGDVHDQWEDEDNLALQHLGVDLVLFVGDFGNESVNIVRAIASLDLPKAVILGNHDAWYSASEWGKKKKPYDDNSQDRVQEQLDLLGINHVGYGKLDFPEFNFTIVGSRPFSWGGQDWKNGDFYRDRYNINNFAESTERIVASAKTATYKTIIFLGHNGPFGLGDHFYDPCGRDWRVEGGDFGDPDFANAIAQTRNLGKTIPLVVFGHMHHQLKQKDYTRIPTYMDSDQTMYFNAAIVPRIVKTTQACQRNFSLVCLQAGIVERIASIWTDENFHIVSEQVFYDCTQTTLTATPI